MIFILFWTLCFVFLFSISGSKGKKVSRSFNSTTGSALAVRSTWPGTMWTRLVFGVWAGRRWSLGFRVQGLGFRVWSFWLRVEAWGMGWIRACRACRCRLHSRSETWSPNPQTLDQQPSTLSTNEPYRAYGPYTLIGIIYPSRDHSSIGSYTLVGIIVVYLHIP